MSFKNLYDYEGLIIVNATRGTCPFARNNRTGLATMVEINYWTNGKICAKVAFPRFTKSVKFRSQSRETASKRKPYRGLGTR